VSLVAIGLNHRTVPLDVLEKMTVPESRLPKALADVHMRDNVSEAVVLSTCNRTEVYVYAERFHGAFQDVRDFLAEVAFLPPEDFSDYLYTFYDADAVAHLFNVASGLDSAVLGETEIQGQVKVAWEVAQAEGTVGAALNAVFRHALGVGKRVRTETRISRSITSVSTAAVAMASGRLGGLAERQMVLLGAGEMGGGMAAAIGGIDAAEVSVVSRTWDRAASLAERIGGKAVHLDELTSALLAADVLFTSTGSTSLMLDYGDMSSLMERRGGRELVIVDIAVPRDIEPSAAELPGVVLLDMNDVRSFADSGLRERQAEIDVVRAIISEEVETYLGETSARVAAPLIAELRSHAAAISQGELERFGPRLAGLDDAQREAVEGLVSGIVNKLLHEPSVRLKEAADSPRGDRLAEAMRDLFGL
jgi:glutamyl-tRNA reductase